MRILMVTEDLPHPCPGGLARHVLILGQALHEAGHHVDYLGNGYQSTASMRSEITPEQIIFTQLGALPRGWKECAMGAFNPLRRSYIAHKYAKAVLSLAKDYDVVHYHGHFPNIAHFLPLHINFVQTRHDQGGDCLIHTRFKHGQICKELSPKACAACVTPRPNLLQANISAWAVKRFRHEVACAFRRHKTIFVSEMLRKNWRRVSKVPMREQVIHNFLDITKIRKIVEASILPSDDRYTVFIAAKLYEAKGVRALLEILNSQIPQDIRILIAGEGNQAGELVRKYASESVIFLGWKDYPEVLAQCAAADLVVVPSIWEEPFGLTILEALAVGRPTFALARGGIPELERYIKYPGQLQLFENLEQLATRILSYRELHARTDRLDFSADVSVIMKEIIKVYQASQP